MLGTKEIANPSHPVASDEELISRARAGDREAFDALIERHRTPCLKRALQILHNRGDAEDEAQAAFGRAFQCVEQFRGTGNFASWLCRIVENRCLMRIRKAQNTRFVYLDAVTESNARLELVDHQANPEDELGQEEVATLLRREVLQMPAVFRDVLMLRDREQLPMSHIAERLGITVPAAKSRLLRARRELRSRIGKHCGRKGPGTLLENAAYAETAYAHAS